VVNRFALNLEANGPPGQNGLSGLVVLGSNGEFPFLTSAERIEVLRTAKLEAAKAEQVRLSRLRAFMRGRATHRLLDGGFPLLRE
jgi:hypothetical protein